MVESFRYKEEEQGGERAALRCPCSYWKLSRERAIHSDFPAHGVICVVYDVNAQSYLLSLSGCFECILEVCVRDSVVRLFQVCKYHKARLIVFCQARLQELAQPKCVLSVICLPGTKTVCCGPTLSIMPFNHSMRTFKGSL